MKKIELPENCHQWGGNAVRIFYQVDKQLDIVEQEFLAAKISNQTWKMVRADGLSWYAEESPHSFIEVSGDDIQNVFRTAKKVVNHIAKHKDCYFVGKPK